MTMDLQTTTSRVNANPVAPISVVIPFHRGAATIARTLRSIDAQTLRPAEIIIVDDGSPEPVPAQLAGAVPLRVVRHEHNRGIPAARNTGVSAASGEWIAFIDQDDEWRSWKLEEQWAVAAFTAPADRILVYSRAMSEGEPDPRRRYVRPPTRTDAPLAAGGDAALRALARFGNLVPFITVLVRRDALLAEGGLDESYRGGADDAELMLRLVARGWRLVQASPPGRAAALHHWTGRNYSDPLKWHPEEVRAVESLAAQHEAVRRVRGRALARTHFEAARAHAHQGRVAAAVGHYREAARNAPFWWKPRAALILSAFGWK